MRPAAIPSRHARGSRARRPGRDKPAPRGDHHLGEGSIQAWWDALLMDAAVWSAIGTWFTAFIYIALLVYAIRQVSEASRLRRAKRGRSWWLILSLGG